LQYYEQSIKQQKERTNVTKLEKFAAHSFHVQELKNATVEDVVVHFISSL